jgi:cellulose synthase/poly-beta-1,6-N-acetylglucosamine synthase-like glycosyltransferase
MLDWLRGPGWMILRLVFAISTWLAIGRILLLGVLATRPRRPARLAEAPPRVCVLIPAYNEEAVIERTIRSVLASDWSDFTIVVVDDGSTDATAARVQAIAETTPRVRLLRKSNGGKSHSINYGLAHVEEDVIVSIDADTIVLPGTIRALAERMRDPAVDAVCGNVQVGNVNSILTSLQDVEYVTSQNYDRRAFEVLNCISVVPGATGAWRRSSLLRVGGYSHDTLTEDADVTLTLLRGGGTIVYEAAARSLTEAPETVAALFKQRFRWSYGTLQCLWKHRSAFGRGTLGTIAIPNMILFQILFPLLAPVGDLVLLLSIWRGDLSAIAAGYLTFLVLDLIGSAIAFGLDRRSPKTLWVVLIQRFCYRQFLYYVTVRSLVAALAGSRHGWNKLERVASVEHSPSAA